MALPVAIAGLFKLLNVAATTYGLAKMTGADEALGKTAYNLTRGDAPSTDELDAAQLGDDITAHNAQYDNMYDNWDKQLDLQRELMDAEILKSNNSLTETRLALEEAKAQRESRQPNQLAGLLGAALGIAPNRQALGQHMMKDLLPQQGNPVPKKYRKRIYGEE